MDTLPKSRGERRARGRADGARVPVHYTRTVSSQTQVQREIEWRKEAKGYKVAAARKAAELAEREYVPADHKRMVALDAIVRAKDIAKFKTHWHEHLLTVETRDKVACCSLPLLLLCRRR